MLPTILLHTVTDIPALTHAMMVIIALNLALDSAMYMVYSTTGSVAPCLAKHQTMTFSSYLTPLHLLCRLHILSEN